mmetsp:Transcript_24747/g.74397  ORF Transcript_24747/g.74397 Transcript_24747/m.74397 type:complete len:596 (-) Transcript_24747:100-1887(-)
MWRLVILITAASALQPPENNLAKQFADAAGKQLKSQASQLRDQVVSLPAEAKRRGRAAQIRAAAQSRQRAPDKLDPETITKMKAQGFAWDFEQRTWRRGAKPREDVPVYGRTDEADPYEEEIWRDEAAREFEDEPVLIKNYRTKRRFRPKEAAEPIVELKEKFGSEEVPEELSRLGFAINDRTGRWERSAPRTGARTVELLGGDKRTLTIKATTETDFKAISRLEYILTYSTMSPPETVWDAALRVARDPTFVVVWAAAQARLWMLFAPSVGLDDFFESAPAMAVDVDTVVASFQTDPVVQAAAGAFVAAAYLRKVAWAGSSGPLSVGAAERAIADGWLTNFTRVPNSPGARQALGLPYAACAGLLTLVASAPRVAVLHGYLQEKLAYDLYAAAPLDALAEGPGAAALLGAAGAAVAAGAAAAAIESVTFTWARPPPTRSDETNAIADALATDALAVRLLETRAEKGEDRPSAAGGPAVVKTMRQAADRAVADGEAFERVADAWLMNFHGLSSAEIEVNDKARETKNYPAIAAAFASGTAAGAAYAAGGLGSALGVHALGSLVDILAPPPSELQPARSAQFDVDAAIGTATTKAD